MSYQQDLNRHLAAYKQTTLGIHEPGFFRYRGRDVLKDHILPVKHAWLNLLPEARVAAQRHLSTNPAVKRHRFFHHLNSSQAFAFSLFFPFFERGEIAASSLLRAFCIEGTLRSWEPEAVPHEEESSNIDVIWTTTAGATTFCEVKLSEGEFGKAANDARHLKKLEELYRPILKGHLDAEVLQPVMFFKHYQILRNIWHLVRTDRSRLIFLLPRANVPLWRMLEEVRPYLSSAVAARVTVVAMEDVLRRLVADHRCPERLRGHAAECARKYVLP